MVMDWSNAFMNGMAKDGYPDLSITDYGIGINEDGVGNGLGFEIGLIAIIETKLCENDWRILIIKNSSTTWVVVFITKTTKSFSSQGFVIK